MQLVFGVMFCAMTMTYLAAQRPELSNAVRAYVSVDAPLIALTHVRVIDGTGAAPREIHTNRDFATAISALGPFVTTLVPVGAWRSALPQRWISAPACACRSRCG